MRAAMIEHDGGTDGRMKRWLLLAVCLLLPLPVSASLDGLTFNTEEYPPFNFLDRQGEIDGTATRLLQAALEQAGLSVTFRLLPWARAYTEARMRDNHCVYSTTRTEEREPHFTWIGPLITNEWAAFALADSPLEADSLDDLSSLRVGSFREDAVGQFVAQRGMTVVVASTERENIGRLRAGLIDAWVTGRQTARLLAADAGIELRELFGFHRADLYLACHPSVSDSVVTRLQAALDRLLDDDRLEAFRRDALEAWERSP